MAQKTPSSCKHIMSMELSSGVQNMIKQQNTNSFLRVADVKD